MTALNDAINRRDALRLLGAAAAWTAVAPTPSAAQADIKAFNVHVDNKDLADLRRRLANTVWPPDATGTPWSMGTDLAYMRQLIAYWKDKYDWRAHEAALNRFDQYTTTIDGQKIHFIHQKSRRPDAIALVMTHGYPGTIWEMLPCVPALVDPTAHGGTAADAFHVIVPALPGYPFSGEPADATNSPRIVDLWRRRAQVQQRPDPDARFALLAHAHDRHGDADLLRERTRQGARESPASATATALGERQARSTSQASAQNRRPLRRGQARGERS